MGHAQFFIFDNCNILWFIYYSYVIFLICCFVVRVLRWAVVVTNIRCKCWDCSVVCWGYLGQHECETVVVSSREGESVIVEWHGCPRGAKGLGQVAS